MKKYQFLIKPLFFIFNLLFASWLVIKIEEIRPSDFGMENQIKNNTPGIIQPCKQFKPDNIKMELKILFENYKSGILDSTELDQKLDAVIFMNH